MRLNYKKGYKYQVVTGFQAFTDFTTPVELPTPAVKFVMLQHNGHLFVSPGYAFDGPSGPTVDTKNFMRGALVHDVLYQLMRHGEIEPTEANRKKADKLLHKLCREDGMSRFRAWYVYKAVRLFGKKHIKGKPRPIISAP